LLMVTNEAAPGTEYGLRDAYTTMLRRGEIEMFDAIAPVITADSRSNVEALAELAEREKELRPNVVLVLSPSGVEHDPLFVKWLLDSMGHPVVIYWEGDAWQRWRKPINASMRAWLGVADVVFTTARHPQSDLLKRGGARDVRFIPNTYCHVQSRKAEETDPRHYDEPRFDVTLIGGRYAHAGLFCRLPGGAARASLVRRLQRRRDLRIAIYGSGWNGRGAEGPVPFAHQTDVIRQALMSVNWDHFPRHEAYATDRLAMALIAGRVHVTTRHRGYDWLPGEDAGLFFEASVRDTVRRVIDLAKLPQNEVLELGAAGYRWVKGRLSDREAARFMLGAVDERYLSGLPEEPWHRFAREWPGRT
jgi:hypothetical protein